jgi:hypothetical protein
MVWTVVTQNNKGFRLFPLFGILKTTNAVGAGGSIVVKPLCYKLEGRGFDSRF